MQVLLHNAIVGTLPTCPPVPTAATPHETAVTLETAGEQAFDVTQRNPNAL